MERQISQTTAASQRQVPGRRFAGAMVHWAFQRSPTVAGDDRPDEPPGRAARTSRPPRRAVDRCGVPTARVGHSQWSAAAIDCPD
ncbi:MAG: hypothetical protein ABIQ58_10690, partial [Candidatus Limnocylindrales bacterium]